VGTVLSIYTAPRQPGPLYLYADDIVILTDSQEKLQEILEILQAVFADWGVEINVGKRK